MQKATKIIHGISVSIERKSSTDIEILINSVPVLLQTNRINTFFNVIEQCLLEGARKQDSFFVDRIADQLEK